MMDSVIKQLKPAMTTYLNNHYGETAGKLKWDMIIAQYQTWIKEEGDLGGNQNFMSSNIKLCYMMCAFYDAIGQKMNQEIFMEIFDGAMGSTLKMLHRFDMNRLQKNKTLMKFVNRSIERYARKSNEKRGKAWGNTWIVEANPDKQTIGIAYTLHSCPLYEFAKKYDYMEVLPYMCGSDHLVASAFHAHLIRHQMISDGDESCQYWYVGDQSKEAKDDPGSK